MDLSQLIVALIGATSTLLAALVGSRSRLKAGTIPTKRSIRRRLIKFGFYFLLGGGATYWAMNWLLPYGSSDGGMHVLDLSASQIKRPGVAFAQSLDTVGSPSVPVGTVVLSVLPPDKFGRLPGGSTYWALADGRALDSSSSYTMLTGNTNVPDLRDQLRGKAVADSSIADSVAQYLRPSVMDGRRDDTAFYWYIRIN